MSVSRGAGRCSRRVHVAGMIPTAAAFARKSISKGDSGGAGAQVARRVVSARVRRTDDGV